MSVTWEEKILHTCFKSGRPDNHVQDIYKVMKDWMPEGDERLDDYRGKSEAVKNKWKDYEGTRPMYQHETRSSLSNLVEKGDLVRVDRGVYIVTEKGKQRLQELYARLNLLHAQEERETKK